MSYCTANGVEAISAEIYLPRGGVWHADLVLAADKADAFQPGAPRIVISAADGKLSWVGSVRSSGMSRGTLLVQVVGGAGGLPLTLPAKSYRIVPVRIPLQDILTEAGETGSFDTDAMLQAQTLDRWTRVQQGAGAALSVLTKALGPSRLFPELNGDVVWRVLPDGTIWVGTDTWPDAKQFTYTLLREDPSRGKIKISANVPSIEPGQTLVERNEQFPEITRRRRVSYVEHHFMPEGLRTVLWFEKRQGGGPQGNSKLTISS